MRLKCKHYKRIKNILTNLIKNDEQAKITHKWCFYALKPKNVI